MPPFGMDLSEEASEVENYEVSRVPASSLVLASSLVPASSLVLASALGVSNEHGRSTESDVRCSNGCNCYLVFTFHSFCFAI